MANEITVTLGIDLGDSEKNVKKAEKIIDNFTKSTVQDFKKADSAVDTFKGTLGALAVFDIGKKLVSGIIDVGKASITSATEIEGLETQLTTLTGSAADARKILGDLQRFSASTPFQLPGLTEAAKTLLSFGFEQDQIIEKLRQLGDVAAGSGKDLGEITLIFSQVAAAGKLTGERLLQLQERGINVGPALAKSFGVAETAVKDLVSSGKVSFADFEAAFASLSAEGGQFFQGTIRQSKTFEGVLSTLNDNIGLVAADIGKELLPGLKALAIGFVDIIQNNQGLINSIKEFIAIGFKATVDGLVASIVPLGETLVIISRAVTGSIVIWEALKFAFNESAEGAINFAAGALEAAASLKELAGFDGSALRNQATALRETAAEFRTNADEIEASAERRIEAQSKFERSVRKNSKSIQDSLQKTIQKERELTATVETEGTKRSTSKTKEAEKQLTEQEQVDAKVLELEQAKADKRVELKANELVKLRELETEDKARKDEEEAIEIELETEKAEARLQRLVELLGREEAIKSEAEARRLEKEGKVAQARKKRQDTDRKAEQNNVLAFQKFENKTQKQKVADLQSTLGTVSTLQQSSNKSLFAAGKAAAIADATINGFKAVQLALGSAPPPFNFVLAALVGAATAQNISKIKSQQPPSFISGGIVPGTPSNTDNVVANVASGEMILNRRQQSQLFDQINSGRTGGDSININIEAGVGGITDEQIDGLITALNDRQEFGNGQLRAS